MNWLAHLYLSKPTAEYRFGNLLPDFAKPPEYNRLSAEIMQGVACHHCIDSFTDGHPAFRRSVARISAPYRRFGGIVIDVFYDHLLTAGWAQLSPVPLKYFIGGFYEELAGFEGVIHLSVFERFMQMKQADILSSYHEMAGVELALARIGRRLRSNIPLERAAEDLRLNYDSLREDFAVFFPELRERVAQFQESQGQRIECDVRS
jgi:acyl carrier protein phosphodiesterase